MSETLLENFLQEQKTIYVNISTPIVMFGIGTHNSLYNEQGNGFLFTMEDRLLNPEYVKIFYLIDKLYKYSHSSRLLVEYLQEKYQIYLFLNKTEFVDYYWNDEYNINIYYLKINLPTSYPKTIKLKSGHLSQIEYIDPKIYDYIPQFRPEQFEYPRWRLSLSQDCIPQLPLYTQLQQLLQMFLKLDGTVHILNAAIFTTRNLNPQIVENDQKLSIIVNRTFTASNKYFDLFPEIVYLFLDLKESFPNGSLSLQSDDIIYN